MKKILSCILAAAMLVGMLAIGTVAADGNQALKFDDTTFKEGGGNVGMGTFDIKDLTGASGYTVSMDFTFGSEGGPCFHPTDVTLKHTSKFAVVLGEMSEGTYKMVGYSATYDYFFLATTPNFPVYGEGSDGLEYLAVSETGLVKPGVTYKLDFEFISDTGVKIYQDGKEVLSFDLYDDLDYPTYFSHSYFMMYPTHITCFIDNVAAYAPDVYDPTTGEGADSYTKFDDFEDAEMVTSDVVDEATGEVTGTVTTVKDDKWQLTEAYSLAVVADDVYGQPQYDVAEGQANLIFKSWLDKKANGASEIFASGQDFVIDVTMANNPGVNSIELDLVHDALITVKDVKAADGLTAKLDGTKLTVTGDNYTGEAIATITYNIDATATQGHFYRYGAKVATAKITGADGDVDAVITNGISKLYNYTVGDMNDDGKFNLRDVSTLLKVVAKWDLPGVFKQAGDVNGDGRTNSMDAAYYLRWLAGWPGFVINGIVNY